MKKLQNNFTTPEQSKRLLEIGVPVDSADCFYYGWDRDGCNPEVFDWYDREISDFESRVSGATKHPCWSVGRLIEICLKCSTLEQRQVRFFCSDDGDEYSIIDFTLKVLESGITTNQMDFSKLED